MYLGVHLDHHRRTVYGTPADPEYLPFAIEPARAASSGTSSQALAIPVLLLARFAILAPLSVLLGPRFRKLIVEGASSLAINWGYRREPPSDGLRQRWLVCEALASRSALSVGRADDRRRLPPRVLGQWYLVSASVAVAQPAPHDRSASLAQLRAARWTSSTQFLDSVNTPGALAGALGARRAPVPRAPPLRARPAVPRARRGPSPPSRDLPPESGYAKTIPRDATTATTLCRGRWAQASRTVSDARVR